MPDVPGTAAGNKRADRRGRRSHGQEEFAQIFAVALWSPSTTDDGECREDWRRWLGTNPRVGRGQSLALPHPPGRAAKGRTAPPSAALRGQSQFLQEQSLVPLASPGA